jgi:hypothetical protein
MPPPTRQRRGPKYSLGRSQGRGAREESREARDERRETRGEGREAGGLGKAQRAPAAKSAGGGRLAVGGAWRVAGAKRSVPQCRLVGLGEARPSAEVGRP